MTAAPSVQDHLPELIAEKERYLSDLRPLCAGLRDNSIHWDDLHCPWRDLLIGDATKSWWEKQGIAAWECEQALEGAERRLDELTNAATGRPEHGGTR